MTEPGRLQERDVATVLTGTCVRKDVSHVEASDDSRVQSSGEAAFDYVRRVLTPAQTLAVKLLTEAALRWHSADSARPEASRGRTTTSRRCLEPQPSPMPVDPADSAAVAAWRNEGDPN
jgi:hypothetical protein